MSKAIYETKFAEASAPVAVARSTVKTTVPRMVDVHPGYAREWAKLQRFELELSNLRYPDPPHPELLAPEFGAGDIDRLEGLRQSRVADLEHQIKLTKGKLSELRSEASAAVTQAALANHLRIVAAMVGPVRSLLAAMREHDAFLEPARGEGVWLSALTGRIPPEYIARELEAWLAQHEIGKRG